MSIEQEPSLESNESNVEKLSRWGKDLKDLEGNLETKIDKLAKKLEIAIVKAEEDSLDKGNQDELMSEVLEALNIMEEVYEIRQETKRIDDLIEQIDKAANKG